MLRWYVAALLVLSASIFVMPIVNGLKERTKIPMVVDGVLFWIALIATVGAAVRINVSRRRSTAFHIKHGGLKKLGLIHFFQNKKALSMDVIMFASLITFIIARFFVWNTTVQFLFVSMFVFSFGMHCMLNGINYIYVKHKATVRRG